MSDNGRAVGLAVGLNVVGEDGKGRVADSEGEEEEEKQGDEWGGGVGGVGQNRRVAVALLEGAGD